MEAEGLRKNVEFKFIEIVNDTNPYLALLGIDREIDNQTIIKFKKMILYFEDSDIRVVAPIDLLEGHRYIKTVHREGKDNYIYQIYNIMSLKEYYIKPTTDGNLS